MLRRQFLDTFVKRQSSLLVRNANRWPTTTTALQVSRRLARQEPNIISTALKRRRYFSSETPNNEASLEECARCLTQAVSSNGMALEESAVELARKLSPETRQEIVRAASIDAAPAAAMEMAAAEVLVEEVPAPTLRDLRLVALAQAIPFLGFGFMDNAILIIAGDAIDTSLGVVLGISTLCAAAIGNIISDVAGILLGTVIEDWCTNYLKLPMPNLSQAQRQLRSVRFASQMGCAVGIVVGCIIGMFPLLFIDSKKIQALKRDAALESIFQDVMTEAKKLIGAQGAGLFIIVENDPTKSKETPIPNPDGQYLYAKNFYNEETHEADQRSFKVGRGIVSRAALTGQAWNIQDVESEPDFRHDMTGQKQRIKNMACVPVLDSGGRTIAVIRAFNKIGEGSVGHEKGGQVKGGDVNEYLRKGFTANDMQVLKALASHISVSLQYMYQEGEQDAAMDLKETINLLKEHGLAGIAAEDKTTQFNKRRPLFPEPPLLTT